MIRLVANFHFKQENVEEAIKLAKELVEKSRMEKGCAHYNLAQSTESSQQIVFLEAWETKAALDAHSASEHFVRIVPALKEMCEKTPVLQSYVQLI